MKASLIIAVYDNIPFLNAVLNSLNGQTEQDFEIIIAEDGENLAMKEFIANYPFAQTWQHITQKDEGWRKNTAMNMAIRAAKADWLIFIDGDCVLHHRFIEMHLRYASEKLILAGKRVKLDPDSSNIILESFQNINRLKRRIIRKILLGKGKTRNVEEGVFLSPDNILWFVPKLRSIKNLKGCNMSFSKKAIESINGFDEDYTLAAIGEDYDLSWRFVAAGYKHKSLRNLAVQYHLYHKESWNEENVRINIKICREKQQRNEYICENGLEKKA